MSLETPDGTLSGALAAEGTKARYAIDGTRYRSLVSNKLGFLKGQWDTNTDYSPGDLVYSLNNDGLLELYISIFTKGSQKGFPPASSPDFWQSTGVFVDPGTVSGATVGVDGTGFHLGLPEGAVALGTTFDGPRFYVSLDSVDKWHFSVAIRLMTIVNGDPTSTIQFLAWRGAQDLVAKHVIWLGVGGGMLVAATEAGSIGSLSATGVVQPGSTYLKLRVEGTLIEWYYGTSSSDSLPQDWVLFRSLDVSLTGDGRDPYTHVGFMLSNSEALTGGSFEACLNDIFLIDGGFTSSPYTSTTSTPTGGGDGGGKDGGDGGGKGGK